MNTNETLRYINEMYNYHIEFENEFNGYLSKFYEKANELKEFSNGKYQIERNINLNKVSVKGYILESNFVKQLNMHDFSFAELKQALINNQSYDNYDIMFSIQLYEILEELERIENNEIDNLLHYIQIITEMPFEDKLNDKSILQELYNSLLNKINNYKISNVINEEQYNKTINCLNILFNYYINGSRKIMEEN